MAQEAKAKAKSGEKKPKPPPEIRDIPSSVFRSLAAKTIDGEDCSFADLDAKVFLITNVSSKCGFTKRNYTEMVELKEKLKAESFEILGFPCNQFGGQEPGNPQEIKAFTASYNVNFPIMEKIDVNGPNTHPVFQTLKGEGGADIRWNFVTKWIVICPAGSETCTIERHDATPNPLELEPRIVAALKSSGAAGPRAAPAGAAAKL
mmetsp:Transcript_23535/g.51622  ORF Transcript_23535/g.51622 Transcript_23535/m.51622 type:complete len:205 (-) Transcript_23535:7-621(-)